MSRIMRYFAYVDHIHWVPSRNCSDTRLADMQEDLQVPDMSLHVSMELLNPSVFADVRGIVPGLTMFSNSKHY
jgi:hypothetical protein